MSVHVVDNSICVFVCYPIPCLSVDSVSVPAMVPPTPTTQPVTSHPATPTLLTPSFPPDPKGNTHSLLCCLYYPPSFSPSFSALLWCLLIWWLSGGLHAHKHAHTHALFSAAAFLRPASMWAYVSADAWMCTRRATNHPFSPSFLSLAV